MEPDLSWIVGQTISDVIYRESGNWWIRFPNGAHVHTESLWRLVADGRIRLTSLDHGNWFGLKAPVMADDELKALIANRTVKQVRLTDCRDLVLDFADNIRLEFLPTSACYEGRDIRFPNGDWIYAFSGGELNFRAAGE